MPKDDGFDNQDKTYQELIKLLEAQEGKLDHLYTDLSQRLSKILYTHKEKIVKSKPLPSFVARRIKNALKRFEKKLYLLIQAGIESSYHLAQRSIERLLRALPLSKELKERYLKSLEALADQRLSDLNLPSKDTSVLQVKLSERVWKLTKQNQEVMGLVLKKGMDQGTSAARLSREIRSYLKEPNKLFRRVKRGLIEAL